MHETTRAVVALGDATTRITAAETLARCLAVDRILLLLRDPVVEAMVPAPGFAPTLKGGPRWREFARLCLQRGRHASRVESDADLERCEALVVDGLALVMFGGSADPERLREVEPLLPLLASALHGEQRAMLARAEADDALASTNRAHILTAALESARQEGSRLNAQLRDEHRRKDEFLAMLAHELRNPLAPLVNSIEILRMSADHSAADRARLLEIMRRQTAHLSRLVDDLLDISRVTRGKIELRLQAVSLWDAVNNAVELNRALIEAKRHTLSLLPPAEPVHVQADPVRLTQIIANVLHNAAKYTPPGGRIDLEAGLARGEAFVRVSDTGIGIAPGMLDAVFELFTQAPGAIEQSQGGLGIGLTLVKSLAEMHGGRVAVESEGVGKGSTFWVRLPTATRGRDSGTAKGLPDGASILLVCGDADASQAMRGRFESSGARVEVAYGALTALQLAVQMDFDLVVVDDTLAADDLEDLASRMRRIVKPATRIVLLGEPPAAPGGLRDVVDMVLSKPVAADPFSRLLSSAPTDCR